MRRSTLLVRTLAVAQLSVLLALAGCGGSGSPTGTNTGGNNGGGGGGGSTSNAISVRDNSFSPNATTVAPGTTVTWTWSGSNPHNVTFDDGSNVASDTQSSGTFSRTFQNAGTYNYHCTVHGAAMSGTITVR